MEGVEGMMRGLKLSEAEKKGIKIGWAGSGKVGAVEVQAIAKLMTDKPAYAEAISDALGPIWCPMKGIDVKDLGENKFLISFNQSSGRRKAVDGGPWTFDKDLLVLEEFDASKNMDDYAFNTIPIWVRIFKLPLGMMSGDTGESIGNQIGEYMETDGLVNGLAVGQYLRIKVRMLIAQPLMRGTTVEVEQPGGSKRMIWCPFQYEYIPNFCFICGIIGHVDRECSVKLKKGEEPQFGKWLKWVPPKRHGLFENRRGWNEGSGRRKINGGNGNSLHGSDGPTWRKTKSVSRESGSGGDGGAEEVRNPMKITDGREKLGHEGVQKQLADVESVQIEGTGKEDDMEGKKKGKLGEVGDAFPGELEKVGKKGDIETGGGGMQKGVFLNEFEGGKGVVRSEGAQKDKMTGKKYKKRVREEKGEEKKRSDPLNVGKKRSGDEMDLDEQEKKKKAREADVEMVVDEQNNTCNNMDEILDHIDPRVTPMMNELLCKEFTPEEVKDALESIGDLKAPGLDGMPSIFYKKYWDIVGTQVIEEKGETEKERRTNQWQYPEGNVLKINTDGAFTSTTGQGGWGFAVRDNTGTIRGSGAGFLANVSSAAHAEAEASMQALKTAAEWGMVAVQIESDSQNLVRALQSTSFDLTPEGVLYRDIRIFMRLHFNSVSVSFAPRDCNNLAHALAAYGVSQRDPRQVWPESLPDDVRVLVASNLAEPVD
ncbi:hypothetical protein QYE76_052522 [Lolium multiflorum]|uniref:CCHC-type domain-containing protein n=1 Tax=Lolium multiflorum TaxID=4521 RepID=A0AAD8STW4_LOLMU|nr:hypothetical protein QYE76_052522 [Lolium multiflorum]